MADTVNPAVFTTSDSYTSDDSFPAVIDDSPCYALLEFPDCFYRVTTLKLVLGREPDDVNSYDHRLVVSDQLSSNPRKRKRSSSGDDHSLGSDSPLTETAFYRQSNYENCITSIGGIGGPQPEPLVLDDPEEVFLAIHPTVDDDGEVRDKAISKQHMRFVFSEELGWTLEVLGRNGVFMNDELHGKGDQIKLEDKDEFTVVGLHFVWHTSPVNGEDSDSEVAEVSESSDEEDIPLRLTVKEELAEQPVQQAYAMDVDDIESEEDDGYNEDEEDEEERPKPRIVLKKKKEKKVKNKKKKGPRITEVKDVVEIAEKKEPTPSLKLKLKVGKANLAAAIKPKPMKTPASKKPAPKLEKADTIEEPVKPIEAEKVAIKQPKVDTATAGKTVESSQILVEEEDAVDVVKSVEKPDEVAIVATATSIGDLQKPSVSPLTPQAGGPIRDPVLAGLEPPPKRRGPGRPPADGVMSKRERRERQKAEAAGLPYGANLPDKAKSKEGDAEGVEKPKKKVKREISGIGEDGNKSGEEQAESAPPAPREPSPKESDYPPERLQKPDETYQVLLYQVLSEAKEPLALPGVYDAIKNKWPYFRFKVGGTGWESSVRHNLQSSKYFKKAGKAGKGHLWAIDPEEPFEHKAKRATPPPSAAPFQAPRPYPYQNGMQMPARPANGQQYPGYYAGQVPMANGQRPAGVPGQQQYPGNFYTHNTLGQPGAPRPSGPYPPQPNGARPGQPNTFGRPSAGASVAPGSTRPNPAFEQVCAGQIPDVFNKFTDQLRKITVAQGNNVAVDQAALAIKWIMGHPRSDEGVEKETPQLQHMVKVLRTLLEPIPNNPPPLRPGIPGPVQQRPMVPQNGVRPQVPAPGFVAPSGQAPQPGAGVPAQTSQIMPGVGVPGAAPLPGQAGQPQPSQPGRQQPMQRVQAAPVAGQPGQVNPAALPPGQIEQAQPMQAVLPTPAPGQPGQTGQPQPPQVSTVPTSQPDVPGTSPVALSPPAQVNVGQMPPPAPVTRPIDLTGSGPAPSNNPTPAPTTVSPQPMVSPALAPPQPELTAAPPAAQKSFTTAVPSAPLPSVTQSSPAPAISSTPPPPGAAPIPATPTPPPPPPQIPT